MRGEILSKYVLANGYRSPPGIARLAAFHFRRLPLEGEFQSRLTATRQTTLKQ